MSAPNKTNYRFSLFFYVLGFYNPVGLLHEVEDFSVGNVSAEIELDPVFRTHVSQMSYGVACFMQLGNHLGSVLNHSIVEVIHIDHAEHVATDIENQHRIEPGREFSEGRFLRHFIK